MNIRPHWNHFRHLGAIKQEAILRDDASNIKTTQQVDSVHLHLTGRICSPFLEEAYKIKPFSDIWYNILGKLNSYKDLQMFNFTF